LPLNVNNLYRALQLWRDVYPLEQVNAELKPGAKPGEAILDARVKEKFPYHVGLAYANDKPPSTGPEQITALFRADSLTRHGDALSFDYGIARSKDDGLEHSDFLGTDDLSATYTVPFTPHDTALGLQYARSSAAIVEAPFDQLSIRSESTVYGVSLSQPILRVPNRDFSLTLSGERKSNQSYLLGLPYSLSDGAVNGESVVSALRLSGQFVGRSTKQVFAARATVNGGLDVLDATTHSTGPDGRFVSVLGQVQYLRRLWHTPNEIMFKLAGQYSPDPLLALEQLSIGGANTVRGYRENTLVRDRGYVATMEFHVPLWLDKDERSKLQLVPFTSYGAGWNNSRATPSPRDISSAGVGLVFTPCKHLETSIFWGHAFRTIHQNNQYLQDDGIHFRMLVWGL
jgi:hemolysin activation/secretion protein